MDVIGDTIFILKDKREMAHSWVVTCRCANFQSVPDNYTYRAHREVRPEYCPLLRTSCYKVRYMPMPQIPTKDNYYQIMRVEAKRKKMQADHGPDGCFADHQSDTCYQSSLAYYQEFPTYITPTTLFHLHNSPRTRCINYQTAPCART